MPTLVEKIESTWRGKKSLRQETLILDATELMCRMMQEKGIKRKAVAKKLGISKRKLSRWLDGEKDISLRQVADIFTALDERVEFQRKS